MIAKVKCSECGKIHDVEMEIDLNNIPENMGEDNEWYQGIFKCVVFKNFHVSINDTKEPTIKDARAALKELEKDFLNKITAFEEAYGITIQYVETNLTGIPMWQRVNGMRTNSVLLYGDL
jgi:hypothetical protein